MNNRRLIRCLSFFVILLGLAMTACAGKKTHLSANAVAAGGVRVSPSDIFSNGSVLVVKVNVFNGGPRPLTYDKAGTRLTLADGRVLTPSSRTEAPRAIDPGTSEMVRIDFRSSGFNWKQVAHAQLDLSGTLLRGGAPSPIPPMDLVLGDLRAPPLADVDSGQIVISEQIQFRTGSAEILSESQPIVVAVADIIAATPRIARLRVEGHTDSTGSAAVNLELSRRRAAAVVEALVARGVSRDRLKSAGFGDTQPLDSNATDDGRQRNRRVEFHIEN